MYMLILHTSNNMYLCDRKKWWTLLSFWHWQWWNHRESWDRQLDHKKPQWVLIGTSSCKWNARFSVKFCAYWFHSLIILTLQIQLRDVLLDRYIMTQHNLHCYCRCLATPFFLSDKIWCPAPEMKDSVDHIDWGAACRGHAQGSMLLLCTPVALVSIFLTRMLVVTYWPNCVCACACVCAHVYMYMCVIVCVCVCVCVYVCIVCMYASVCVCVCVCERERERNLTWYHIYSQPG